MPFVLHVKGKRKRVPPQLPKSHPCPSGFCVAALHSSSVVQRPLPRDLTDVQYVCRLRMGSGSALLPLTLQRPH